MRGQYDKALAAYDEALENPEIADFIKASIYSDRGVAKWRLKQTKEAVDDFNQSIQISPENAQTYNNRGNALMDLGHPEEAVKDFDRAIALSPNYGAAYNNRGNAHAALAQYEPAFQDYRKAVELMPSSAVALNGRGKSHAALKRYHAALRDFTRAVSLNAKYEAAYANRGETNLALDKDKDAADDFTQALTIQPDQPDLLLLRARANAGDKKFNAAVDDLNKVIQLKPDFVDAYIERGSAYTQVKRLDDAIADLSHAIELDPKNTRAYVMRATAKFQASPPKKPQAESVVAKQTAAPPAAADAKPGTDPAAAGAAAAPDAAAASGAAPAPDAAGTQTANASATATPTTEAATAAATPATDPAAATPAPDGSAAVAAPDAASAPDVTTAPGAVAEVDPNAMPAPVSEQASNAALDDAQAALALAPDDAGALRVRADIYKAMGRTDEAIADYRRSLELDPFQTESRDALVKLDQDVPAEQGLPLGPPVQEWVIKEPSPGRYIASNPKYPKLRAELEMFGAGKPRIIEWSQMKDALAGIGLLRYYAGDSGEATSQELLYTAILDLWANKVVSIEPFSWGANSAQWNWQAYSVVVTDPNGSANEIKLRKPRTRPASREEAGGWDSPWGGAPQGPGRRRRRRRRAAAADCSAGSGRVTLFLASVRDAAEAGIALQARADIVDVKEPANGALGAADRVTIEAIIAVVGGRAPVSATIGDLPMQPATISDAVLAQAAAGVDYVKFGLFPGGDPKGCLTGLAPITRNVRLIMVLFADNLPSFDAVSAAAAIGICGVMLDTADKSSGSLHDHLDLRALSGFVSETKAHGLAVGLAGSLAAGDVPALLGLQPDLLGFRGALCGGARNASLDPLSCAAIRASIPEIADPSRPLLAKVSGAPAHALC